MLLGAAPGVGDGDLECSLGGKRPEVGLLGGASILLSMPPGACCRNVKRYGTVEAP